MERPGRPKVPEEALVWVGCIGGCAFTDDGKQRWLGGELILQDHMFVHGVPKVVKNVPKILPTAAKK